jgi:hypothetical protein
MNPANAASSAAMQFWEIEAIPAKATDNRAALSLVEFASCLKYTPFYALPGCPLVDRLFADVIDDPHRIRVCLLDQLQPELLLNGIEHRNAAAGIRSS